MENHEYAGMWIRFFALLIDIIVVGIVCLVPLSLIYGSEYWTDERFFKGFWDLFFTHLLPLVGTVWFWSRFLGTPGKLAFRLKIVDAETGNKMSVGQSVGRYFAYVLSILPLFLGVLWVGVDKRKQGWHDKLARTVVLREIREEDSQLQSCA